MSRGLKVIFVAVVLFAAGACKRTVEGETSRWSRDNDRIKELAVLYPAWKPALDERQAAAKALWDGASSVGDEKQRIEKLAQANGELEKGFIADLQTVDSEVKAVRAKLVEVSGAATDPAGTRRIEQAKQNAERTLADVQAMVKRGAADAAGADVLARKITGDLRGVKDQLAQAAPQTAAPDAGKGVAAAATAPAPAPAEWKCEYCDHVNFGSADKCSNCGAARPAKK